MRWTRGLLFCTVASTNQVGRRRVNGPPRGTGGISSGADRKLPTPTGTDAREPRPVRSGRRLNTRGATMASIEGTA